MKSLQVLIVEDEFLVADYISDVVMDAGHQVVGVAPAAETALEMILSSSIDLAIMDVRLAGEMDGVDLATRVKELAPATAHLFVSGSGDPQTKQRALATAPLAFLQKPFRPESLIELIEGVAAPPAS